MDVKCITVHCIYMFNFFQLFESGNLGKQATADVLKDLLYNLLVVLLDTRLNGTDEGPNVIKSVNILVVKIVDKSDHTQVMW